MNDAEMLERIQRGLKCGKAEAESVLAYDKAVDHGEATEFDLTPEQEQNAAQMRRADRKPTAYKFEKRERKPNATKGLIIAELAGWLKDVNAFECGNITVTNKERQITFTSNGETFELTLVQKRKPK